jgi:hypothetical protein
VGRFRRSLALAVVLGGCGATGAKPDAAPAATNSDAGSCPVLALTAAQACALVPTGRMSACAMDPITGDPSQTGYLEIRPPGGGAHLYACATSWQATAGYRFENPVLVKDPSACCNGDATMASPAQVPQPATGDDYLGVEHAPLQLKPQEMMDGVGGDIRQNPFAVVGSSRAAAAALQPALLTWDGWAGDGAPHPAPDGTGAYYFPQPLTINYVILRTTGGAPVFVVAPEVSLTADGKQLLGHPTLGVCAERGGAPLALIGGEIHGATLNNESGRFGLDKSVTPEALQHAARLFNCYGIPIAGVEYVPPRKPMMVP